MADDLVKMDHRDNGITYVTCPVHSFDEIMVSLGFKPITELNILGYGANFLLNDMKGLSKKAKMPHSEFLKKLTHKDVWVAFRYGYYGIINRHRLRDLILQHVVEQKDLKKALEGIMITPPTGDLHGHQGT